MISTGNENGVKWEIDNKGRKIYIKVISKDGIEFNEVYECQYDPLWGYDVVDVNSVNRILDEMIKKASV